MKKLTVPLAVVLALFLPGIASAHTFTNEDFWAIHAMGYRAWAATHNQVAPSDPVGTCVDPSYPNHAPEFDGANRCTAAELAAVVAQQETAAEIAYLNALTAAWQAQAAQPHYSTVHCDGDSTIGWTCTSY